MSIIVPQAVEQRTLEYLLTTEDLLLKLYSNNVTPDFETIASDFTEVSGGGYAQKTLDKDNWTIVGENPTIASYAKQTWTFTGTPSPGTVYGYYVVDQNGDLVWSERFPGSITPFEPGNNSVIDLTPQFQVS